MSNRLAASAILLAGAVTLGAEETVYRIDLIPSGKMISKDVPTLRGTTYVFHQYPSGVLMSLRKSSVKQIAKMPSPAQPAAPANPKGVVSIGDLAMEGGASGGSSGSGGGASIKGGPAAARGFYGNLVPGGSVAQPNSRNDYQVGRSVAAPPASATQSSPGQPPKKP